MTVLKPNPQLHCSTSRPRLQPFQPSWRPTSVPLVRQRSTLPTAACCRDAPEALCPSAQRLDDAAATATSTSSGSGSSGSSSSSSSRRSLLAAALLAAAGAAALPPPAMASVTLSVKARSKATKFQTKGGYEVTVPSTWTMAYDRSGSATERGTLVLFADFKSLETLSITKQLPLEAGLGELTGPGTAPLEQLTASQVADAVLAPDRNNQSTYAFKLLAAEAVPASPNSYLLEYVQQVCRGNITEGSGGTRRCTNPRNDADLQIVSRHYLQLVALLPDGLVYSAKGSATSERWPEVAADMLAAVQSFRVSTATA